MNFKALWILLQDPIHYGLDASHRYGKSDLGSARILARGLFISTYRDTILANVATEHVLSNRENFKYFETMLLSIVNNISEFMPLVKDAQAEALIRLTSYIDMRSKLSSLPTFDLNHTAGDAIEFWHAHYSEWAPFLHQGMVQERDPHFLKQLEIEAVQAGRPLSYYIQTSASYAAAARELFLTLLGHEQGSTTGQDALTQLDQLSALATERGEAEKPQQWAKRVGQRSKPDGDLLSPLPLKAPALWSRDKEVGDTPVTFIVRHYARWLGKGLSRPDIKRLDASLYMGLANWLRKNEFPDGFDLPTKKEQTDSIINEIISGDLPADRASLRRAATALTSRAYKKL